MFIPLTQGLCARATVGGMPACHSFTLDTSAWEAWKGSDLWENSREMLQRNCRSPPLPDPSAERSAGCLGWGKPSLVLGNSSSAA